MRTSRCCCPLISILSQSKSGCTGTGDSVIRYTGEHVYAGPEKGRPRNHSNAKSNLNQSGHFAKESFSTVSIYSGIASLLTMPHRGRLGYTGTGFYSAAANVPIF